MNYKKLFSILIIFIPFFLMAKESKGNNKAQIPHSIERMAPLYLEPFVDKEGTTVFMNFSKPIAKESRFGVFNITEFYGVYDIESQKYKNQFVSQSHLTYGLFKNLSVSLGLMLNHIDGFRPTAGLQFHQKINDFFILFAPRIDLTQSNNGELFAFVQYNPNISQNWGIYSRVQALYNRNLDQGTHAFSYLRLRVGMSYKNYRFGLGSNFSNYGPAKINDSQFGIFVGTLLF